MIRSILLCMMLIGCASANKKDTHSLGEWERDGCIAVRCKAYCKEDATPEQVAAFHAGVVDAGEQKQLDRLKFWLVGDTTTTVAALSFCEAASETNPILGADPNPVAVAALGVVVYAMALHDAKASPYWCSSERPIRIAANVRMAASINNAAIAVLCP